jgi:CBS domain containing-hemolysin-like protein
MRKAMPEPLVEVLVTFLVVAVLIALNALFVAAEFAVVGAPRSALEQEARAGSGTARWLTGMIDRPVRRDRFIATAQLGITLASLGLGMYGEHKLAEWIVQAFTQWGLGGWAAAHVAASTISIVILTYFHIVIGEMVPKSLALSNPTGTVMRIAWPMRVIQFVTYPFVYMLNGVGNLVLRAMGLFEAGQSEQFRTPEELAFIVEESQAGGLLREESADILQELLEFGDLRAREVLVPRVQLVGIPLGADRETVLQVMMETPHTRYPVYDGDIDHVVGMLHVKDVLRRLGDMGEVTAAAVRPVPFVPETATTEEVLAAMRRTRTQMAVVLDEYGGTAGIVTVEDLFEEVVGEISDTEEVPSEHHDEQGRLHLAGTVRLEDAADALGIALEHEEVSTVGGLVLSLLGRAPRVGDVVEWEEARFRVVAVEGHGVAEVVAEVIAGQESVTNE